MAIAKRWEKVLPQSITVNGSYDGIISVADSSLFHVGQRVKVFSDVVQPYEYIVNKIISPTAMRLGRVGWDSNDKSSLTTLLVSDNSKVSADEQDRPSIVPDSFNRAVYEEEPVVALRSVLIDSFGRKITSDNPLPVTGSSQGQQSSDLQWDDLQLTRDNTTQDIVSAAYKKNGVTVQTLTLSYDAYENLDRVQKS